MRYVIVIPWFVRLHVEIIHWLYRLDYLTYKWTGHGLAFYNTYISVDLAHYEIPRDKVSKGGIKVMVQYLISTVSSLISG